MLFVSLRDLQWRRRRFTIGVLATGLVFALALLISGVSGSFHNEIGRAVRALGVDRWVVPANVSGPFTSTSMFPESVADAIASMPGVRSAEPVVLLRTSVDAGGVRDLNLIGLPPGGAAAPRVVEGRLAHAKNEMVVDTSLGVPLGRTVRVATTTFTVVGRTRGLTYYAGTPAAVVGIADLQRTVLNGAPLATAIVVKGAPTTAPAGYRALTNADVEHDLGRPMKNATQTIDFLRVLLWVVAAGIIGSVLYLQAIERSRDFAVFKATGVTTRTLLAGLATQAVVLALSAAIAAVLLSFVLSPAVSMAVEVPASAYVALPVVALAVGLLSSLVALRRAVTVDPALAFGG